MAMYWTGVPLRYSNWSRRELTAGSKTELESLADLRDRYRQACLHAFVTRDDPELRFALSLGFTLDPAACPPELLPELGHAQRIILADPGRYERILHTLNDLTRIRLAPARLNCQIPEQDKPDPARQTTASVLPAEGHIPSISWPKSGRPRRDPPAPRTAARRAPV
jgi:hypothetical protein